MLINCFFEPQYRFSCYCIIQYIYENGITENMWEDLTIKYENFIKNNTTLQIVEIAINNKNNKNFIRNVLSNLIKNSKGDINIYTYDTAIQITNYISIDNILQFLIPFSSENIEFFNIFRQPYVKLVDIILISNRIKKYIKCLPIIKDGNVVDIEYDLREESLLTNEANETTIILHFNISKIILSEILTDGILFIKNYLSYIPNINIYLNDENIKVEREIIYENEIGKIIYLKDITKNSFIISKDISFISIKEFCDNLNTNNGIKYDFINMTENCIVIDFIDTTENESLIKFINNGLYLAILTLYINNYYINPDTILYNTNSQAWIYTLQLQEYGYGKYENEVSKYKYNKQSISTIINQYIKQFWKKEINFSFLRKKKKIIDKAIYKWFSNKQFIMDDKIYNHESTHESFDLLQVFINIYWSKIKILITENKLQGVELYENPPIVYSKKLGVLGYYNPASHILVLNSIVYNMEEFNKKISDIKDKSIEEFLFALTYDTLLIKYFATNIPTTLIHELGHSINNNRNSSTSDHGMTNIIYNNGETLYFEDMCKTIYLKCIEKGMFIEYYNFLNLK